MCLGPESDSQPVSRGPLGLEVLVIVKVLCCRPCEIVVFVPQVTYFKNNTAD